MGLVGIPGVCQLRLLPGGKSLLFLDGRGGVTLCQIKLEYGQVSTSCDEHQIRPKDYLWHWVEPIAHRHGTLPNSRPQARGGARLPYFFLLPFP